MTPDKDQWYFNIKSVLLIHHLINIKNTTFDKTAKDGKLSSNVYMKRKNKSNSID
jgi:hypothetical protein